MRALPAAAKYKWPKHSRHPLIRGPIKVSSSTPGKQKGPACQASPLDRDYAKRSRAYRDPLYVKTGSYRNWWKNGVRKQAPGSITIARGLA